VESATEDGLAACVFHDDEADLHASWVGGQLRIVEEGALKRVPSAGRLGASRV
jgi:hypothetical protein